MILPTPTSGETIPPNANPNAPNKADAVPAFARSLSMANVLDAVKVSPSIKLIVKFLHISIAFTTLAECLI